MRSLVLVAVLIGCYSSPSSIQQGTQHGPPKGTWGGFEALANVPAETPYVFALLEQPPEAVHAKMWAGVDDKVIAAIQLANATPLDQRLALTPTKRALYGVLDAMRGKDPQRWWENLGFKHGGRWVAYGLGIWPVLRVEVGDANKTRAIVTDAIKTANLTSIQAKQLGSIPYWVLTDAGVSVVVSITDQDAVIALLPAATLDQTIGFALGTQRVTKSLRDSGEPTALLARHHFTSMLLSYIDSHRMIAALERSDAFATKPVFSAPACHDDYERIAAVAPRLTFGYTKLDVTGFAGAFVQELAPGVAHDLGALRTALPAPPDLAHVLMAETVAVDLDGFVVMLRRWLTALADRPLQCPELAFAKEAVADGLEHTKTLLPKELAGIKGGQFVVDDASDSPPGGSGHVVVFGDQLPLVIAEQLKKVGLAGLAIAPDGTPLALPVGMLGIPSLTSAHLAMVPGRAAVAVGDHSKTEVSAALAAKADDLGPLASFGWDIERTRAHLPSVLKDRAELELYESLVMTVDVRDDALVLGVTGTWLK